MVFLSAVLSGRLTNIVEGVTSVRRKQISKSVYPYDKNNN
jgi:hypothetical protein